MDAKKLFSKEVLDAQGNKIGKIADIDVDMALGVVNHIVVTAGLTKKHKVKLHQIMTIGDKVILNVKRDELEK